MQLIPSSPLKTNHTNDRTTTVPGVGDIAGEIHSLPQLKLNASREEILAYFTNSWMLSEVLFSGLANDEAYYRRPYHQLRHPMIFYYGHPMVLYVNKLRVAGLLNKSINAAFEQIFETGVDEMRWDDLHDGEHHSWPTVAEVREYRQQVYCVIKQLIETHPFLEADHLPITQKSPMWALVMAFEHDRIHFETSSVLMRELPIEFLRKPDAWPSYYSMNAATAAPHRMVTMPSSNVTIGKPQDYPTFGWDNEYGNETRIVRAFEASDQLISNAEFLTFVKAGGYTAEQYWSRDGWEWRRFRNIKCPTFWVPEGPAGLHNYKLRTIFEIIAMQPDWPACVNFHEAKAYCAWKSECDGGMPYRLLTEAEHHAIRDDAATTYNSDLAFGSESPVDALPANRYGFHDVFGNVWQWCEDTFHPLAGSNPHAYYDDFSAPCYDNEHQIILGGSFISTGDLAQPFARFHFRPHFYQHAGFRIVRSMDGNPANDAKRARASGGALNYETQSMLNTYMLMHWGTDAEIAQNVPVSHMTQPDVVHLPLVCAELVTRHAANFDRAMDLGCAVGRSTFELARDFAQVIGVDYSREFVEHASALQTDGELAYWRKDSGDTGVELTAHVDANIDRSRIRFEQNDACALPLHLKDFDAVLMANVLCRLPDPMACLSRMQGTNALVKHGGVLVMTTPLSWLEQYTPKSRWLNGLDDVKKALNEFELIHQEELPFVIREHARKFEYIITQATVWRRK